MKFLIIDDSPVHREQAKFQLKEHQVIVAENYDEAKKLLTSDIFDAVAANLLIFNCDQLLIDKGYLLAKSGVCEDCQPPAPIGLFVHR